MAEDRPFYTKVTEHQQVQVSKDAPVENVDVVHQLITDKDQAEDIARIEEGSGGRALARAHEQYLHHLEDPFFLTDEQKKHVALVEGIMAKYPHALEKKIASDGTPIYLTREIPWETFSQFNEQSIQNPEHESLIFRYAISSDGIVRIVIPKGNSTNLNEARYEFGTDTISLLDGDALQQIIANATSMSKLTELKVTSKHGHTIEEGHYICKTSLADIAERGPFRKNFSATLKQANLATIEADQTKSIKAEETSVASIVAGL